MKPHALLRLREGASHRAVGSWLDVIDNPESAGPPFEPEVDRVLATVPGGVLITREYRPARPDGWSAEERAFGLDRVFRIVRLINRPFEADVLATLRALPTVEEVENGWIANTPIPLATSQSRRPSDWAPALVGLDEAHQLSRGDPDITVAVLDTGIDLSHPEYAGRLLPGFDFVDIIDGAEEFIGDKVGADADPTDPGVGHGSHVTGIIAARGERMPVGVAPRCRVLPVRVLGALRQGDRTVGAGLVDNINAGIKWAVDRGADVVNMSLGIRHDGGGLPHRDVIRYAQRKGVTVVAAAGNDGTDTLYYPGALPGVLAVGAVGRDDGVAPYSTWGAQVDIVAPGTDIWSSWLDGGYAFAAGTSQATPFVAGAAALCKSLARAAGRRLGVGELNTILTGTADRGDTRFRTARAGHGRLNVPDALALTLHRLDSRTTTRTARVPAPALT